MLERLPPNVSHCRPAQAMGVLEEPEETAKFWPISQTSTSAMDTGALAKLQQPFGCRC